MTYITHTKKCNIEDKKEENTKDPKKLQQQIKQKDAQTCNNTQLQKEEETQPCKLYINDALKRKKSSKDYKRKKMGQYTAPMSLAPNAWANDKKIITNQVQPLLARFNNSLERYTIEVATCHLGGLLFSKAILLAFNHSSLQSITNLESLVFIGSLTPC